MAKKQTPPANIAHIEVAPYSDEREVVMTIAFENGSITLRADRSVAAFLVGDLRTYFGL